MIEISTTSEKTPSEYTTDNKYKGLDKRFTKYIGFLPTMTEYYLHFICYIGFYQYYAYDIYSNKVFKVRFETGCDCDWNDYYLEEVSLNTFKEDIRKHSERYYNLLKGITEENKNELRFIQFGEVKWVNQKLTKLETKNGVILALFTLKEVTHSIELNGKKHYVRAMVVKYAEMDKKIYDELFGNCKCLSEVYDIFNEVDSTWYGKSVMSIQITITGSVLINLITKRKKVDVYRSVCETYIKDGYITERIEEQSLSGHTLDIIDHIRRIMRTDENKSYIPIQLIDDEIVKSTPFEYGESIDLRPARKAESIIYKNVKKAFKISLTAVFASIVLGCCIPIEIIGFLYFAALGSTVITAILMGIFKE